MAEAREKKLTNRDLNRMLLRWYTGHETMRTYERGIGPAFFYGMNPALKKIYGDNDEQLREATKRSLNFFNGQFSWCASILGIAASLEEERKAELDAGNEPMVSGDMIESTKTALFGPLAGIGDSISNGTLHYIFISLFLPLAMNGNWLGAVLPAIVFSIWTYIEGTFFIRMGYNLGRQAAAELLGGGMMSTYIDGLSLLGVFMTGIIGSTFVSLSSSLVIELQGNTWAIQEILDGIMPGLLPLALIMGVYFYFEKKGLKPLQAIGWITLIVGTLAAIGIL
ncbi:PTS mannose transporter subunit IID [Suicoccus acidiformans]|uniref:PTS mannose transporter subunit IID n=1 Tax=Suicoccus acidiformans TaxID=2036206 RepID=A0A347WIH9_9LACT|nr:PTS system mannose/fructose/sorbose family transporter subunit IID [Suicoccus acidiformans]AXY24886.1 PTS mannose transporter subunit IID [Suicoccus acidiformans]